MQPPLSAPRLDDRPLLSECCPCRKALRRPDEGPELGQRQAGWRGRAGGHRLFPSRQLRVGAEGLPGRSVSIWGGSQSPGGGFSLQRPHLQLEKGAGAWALLVSSQRNAVASPCSRWACGPRSRVWTEKGPGSQLLTILTGIVQVRAVPREKVEKAERKCKSSVCIILQWGGGGGAVWDSWHPRTVCPVPG